VRTMSEVDAIAGLRSFRSKFDELDRQSAYSTQVLRTYAELASPLVGADASRRLREIEARSGEVLLASHFVPSLVELAQLDMVEETRFSLLLASLLDPQRCGPLARRFWRDFLSLLRDRVHACATETQRERVDAATKLWTDARVARACVTPTKHASELHHFDVFARVHDGERYECGLVIENKVNKDTGEQENQLDRYWWTVGQEYRAQGTTLFVFLTEGKREMQTARESNDWWIQVTWQHVAELCWKAAEDEQLPLGHRLLALQVRDLVRSRILDLPTLGDDRHELEALRAAVIGRPPGHPAWVQQHSRITALWTRAVGDHQQ